MLWLNLALLLATSPFAQPSVPPPTPIYGGEEVEPGGWPSAVAVSIGGSLCSGTLIHERIVLTAAHCVMFQPSPQGIAVYVGESIHDPTGSWYHPVELGIHPDYCPYGGECKKDLHDFAYLVLDRDVEDVTPTRPLARQVDWNETMFLDAQVSLVGFGADESGQFGIKRQVDVDIVGFSASGLEFRAGGEGRDTCSGDSGGSAFVQLRTGEYLLAGVTSRGFTDCGEGGFYGVPYGALCWLSEATGVEFRPEGYDTCDYLDPFPEEERCGCATEEPGGALLGFGLVGWATRRRKQTPL